MENALVCPNCGASVVNEDQKLVINQQVAVKCAYCGSEWIPGQNVAKAVDISVATVTNPHAVTIDKPASAYAPPPPSEASEAAKKVVKIIMLICCFFSGALGVICLGASIAAGMKGWGIAAFFGVLALVFWSISRLFR